MGRRNAADANCSSTFVRSMGKPLCFSVKPLCFSVVSYQAILGKGEVSLVFCVMVNSFCRSPRPWGAERLCQNQGMRTSYAEGNARKIRLCSMTLKSVSARLSAIGDPGFMLSSSCLVITNRCRPSIEIHERTGWTEQRVSMRGFNSGDGIPN